MGGAEKDRTTLVEQIAREETHLARAEEARERAEKRLSDLRRQLAAALLHGAAMIKVVPSIDEDQAIG